MAPNPACLRAERRTRRLLEEQGLPQPDAVEYRATEVVFLWEAQKVAVVIEAGQSPPSAAPSRGPARA